MLAEATKVGPVFYEDGADVRARADRFGQIVTDTFIAEQVARGNGYVATSVAASITALGNNIPTIWNKSDSGKLVIIDKISIGSATVGTAVMTSIVYGAAINMGAELHANDGAILTFTEVATRNRLIGSLKASKTKFSGVVSTFTTAPTIMAHSGFSASGTVSGFGSQTDKIDGGYGLMPGTVFQVGATTTTSTSIGVSIYFIEVDVRFAES